jgi:hypothetical protein
MRATSIVSLLTLTRTRPHGQPQRVMSLQPHAGTWAETLIQGVQGIQSTARRARILTRLLLPLCE